MTTFVAFVRGINVGGANALPMADLRAMCAAAKCENIETYIASGNVIFDSALSSAKVKSAIEQQLQGYFSKPISVMVRTDRELIEAHGLNPFSKAPAKHTYAFFLDAAPPPTVLDHIKGLNGERIAMGKREIYVHYPHGMGVSKLKIPSAADGTARNMHTIGKLAGMVIDRAAS